MTSDRESPAAPSRSFDPGELSSSRTAPDLSKQAFRTWLESLPDDQPAGIFQHTAACPIAAFMVCQDPDKAAFVGYKHYSIGSNDGDLPEWAYSFVDKLDREGVFNTPVSKSAALAVLDSIETGD